MKNGDVVTACGSSTPRAELPALLAFPRRGHLVDRGPSRRPWTPGRGSAAPATRPGESRPAWCELSVERRPFYGRAWGSQAEGGKPRGFAGKMTRRCQDFRGRGAHRWPHAANTPSTRAQMPRLHPAAGPAHAGGGRSGCAGRGRPTNRQANPEIRDRNLFLRYYAQFGARHLDPARSTRWRRWKPASGSSGSWRLRTPRVQRD